MVDESQGLAAGAVTHAGISRRLLFAMLGFGLVVAVLFPPFTTLALGVPLAVTYGIPFFPLCVFAGLTVGALNHLIFRRVVQDYLLDMHGRIAEFRNRIEQQAAGKAVECTPEECHLDVRSPDIFGDLAGSFNAFIDTTTDCLRTLRDTDRFLTGLEGKARLEEVADVVLDAFETHFGAVGSILLVLERGELGSAQASNVTATRQQLDHDQLLTPLLNGQIVVLRDLPDAPAAVDRSRLTAAATPRAAAARLPVPTRRARRAAGLRAVRPRPDNDRKPQLPGAGGPSSAERGVAQATGTTGGLG